MLMLERLFPHIVFGNNTHTRVHTLFPLLLVCETQSWDLLRLGVNRGEI